MFHVHLGGMCVLLFLVDCYVHVYGVQLIYSAIQILSVLVIFILVVHLLWKVGY